MNRRPGARLRLSRAAGMPRTRLPARRRAASPSPPEPRRPFPVGGTLLIVVSAVLVAAAWSLFGRGQPGAPTFPDLRPDYGLDAGIVVHLPGDAPITWSAFNAVYEQKGTRPGGEAVVEQDLNLTHTLTTAPSGPLWAVVELRGAARVDQPTVAGNAAESIELGDRQLILVDLGEGSRGTGRVRGLMRVAPLASENSRTAFASPTVGVEKSCAGLAGVTASGRLDGLTYGRWTQVADGCRPTAYERQTFIRLVTGSAPVRVDYVETHPMEAGGSPMFRWKSEGTAASLRVRSSFVDLNGEAVAQRLLFLAGVAVGLATACAPYGVQTIFVHATSRTGRRPGRQPD
jgi:hypothetical protein